MEFRTVVFRMYIFVFIILFISMTIPTAANSADDKPDWQDGRPDGCTTITVGKNATDGGWVTTSHTCDSHRTRSEVNLVPQKTWPDGSRAAMMKRVPDNSQAMPAYRYSPVGEIPQVGTTNSYINTAYPCMNQYQLAIGESTFEGRPSLKSDNGMIDCQQLVQLLMERCKTAREAIKLADNLTKTYGYIDDGECLTIADKKEVWHLEITGPGKGNKGAVWAAQRVPDDYVSVCANASRIREIDLTKPDFFMASANVKKVAQDSGWWNPANKPFEFCYAYDPEGRESFSARRREWRVLSMVAPSLNLHANDKDFPFSVRPDTLVTLQKLVTIFKDYYEGTDYNFVKNITQADSTGKEVISPFANPFMPYEMNKLFKVNGGWGELGERTIARWYTMYATITQSREWMPDEIGGVVWLAFDNVATSIYVPVYCGVTDLPRSFKTPGRTNGFTRDSVWWAFNRLGTLTAQRWGDMHKDVDAVWNPLQKEMFDAQTKTEIEAILLFDQSQQKAVDYITRYTTKWGDRVVERCWKLGDELWTKYDEKW
ncbi:MAG TPA: C69 family dipeptidase [bacterium]|nr:C69 family dipeptidase [bacterium]HPN45546.1 C69 family dipeptidase [bacterium]